MAEADFYGREHGLRNFSQYPRRPGNQWSSSSSTQNTLWKSRDNYSRSYSNDFQSHNNHTERNSDLGSKLTAVTWNVKELPSFNKDFYTEHPDVSKKSEVEITKIREDLQMTIYGNNIPRPVTTFEESNLPDYVQKMLKSAGFEAPTHIQSQGWPIIMSGRDLIGIAKTGSGKTLGFILPAIVHILDQPQLRPGDGPIALVLSPTRELAMQTSQECSRFGRPCRVSNACVYGGAPRSRQQMELQRGVHVVIATPGRLIDFLENGATNLKRVTYLVLDEADRMLDMGFEPQIRKIIEQIRPDRQTVMFSATWPKEVQALAKDFSIDPVHLQIGSLNLSANQDIKQVIEIVDESFKLSKVVDIVHEVAKPGSKTIIFCETKKGCEVLCYELKKEKFTVDAIHGDKTQRDRDQVLRDFRNNKINIMVATDVASRGLDVKDVNHVINYDFPGQVEDYIHRIGRTARAGAKGTAISFFTQQNARMAGDLIKLLKESKQEIPDKLYDMNRSNRPQQGNNRYNRWGYQSRNYAAARSRSPRRAYYY